MRLALFIRLCVAGGLLLPVPAPARADPVDTVGATWMGRGSAGACAAASEPLGAAFYNPARLGLAQQPAFALGAAGLYSGLTPAAADSGHAAFAELDLHFPVLEFSTLPPLWLGVSLMTPPTYLYRMELPDDEELSFASFQRERRLSFSAALGLELFDVVALGVGFQLLPTVDGHVGLDLSDGHGDNHLHVDVGYALSPVAGLIVTPVADLRLALSYRGRSETSIHIPVDVQAEGIALSASVAAQTFFVPHRLAFAVAWDVGLGWSLEADVGWHLYSRFAHPSPEVALYDSLGNESSRLPVEQPHAVDVITPALAVRYRGWLQLVAGYRFAPAAIEKQPGVTNLLDGDRHTAGAGLKIPLFPGASKTMRLFATLDLFASYLPRTIHQKEEILAGNPGYPSVEFGGWRAGGGVGLEVEYDRGP